MDYCTPQSTRRHNPVDSICRKLQTIQWRGDREPNSPFQIPKLSSSNYDSPQCDLRHNLEDILKKRAIHGEKGDRERAQARGKGMLASTASSRNSLGPSVPPSTPSCPFTPASNPTNVTYTITSTLGERRGAGCGSSSGPRQAKTWQKYCSTPSSQAKDSPYFTFTQKAECTQPESERQSTSPPLRRSDSQGHSMFSYNLNFCSSDLENTMECELPYPALVVKRLSMGDGGSTLASDSRRENMAEVSLICEEDLLDTIFHACDTQRRGKVYVSRIVDYLRHTTSRSSEDSGLEELCNMLDPEHKDVSIDLDTYHAIMKEWIDDCRNNGEEPVDEPTQDSVKLRDSLSTKRSMLLNMTSGSLEAFGGEASRAEFETSELVYCVADLQMSNQKLQEEVRKLKQVVEGMEESNQKLAEENEELRNQARVNQQLVQKEKLLKEEVEEMKATLSYTEEGRTRASAHSKHMERENQSLIAKIAALQEENFKITMETEELQRRMVELCDMNADLQVQIHSFDAVLSEKEAIIQEKSKQITELKKAVEEYSSITELLRADKSKLENQVQMMHPEVTGTGLSLSVAYRLNQTSSGSLQTELALAQSPMETLHTVDHLSSTMTFASPLDETLDREVLLLLQGPSPEHMALEFRSLLSKLKRDFSEETVSVLSSVRSLLDNHGQPEGSADSSLQTVQAELDARRADWAVSLDQLAQYADSLEKELIKMASNMRRSRTEILHLSVRVQEQENQKRQLCEELEQLRTPQDSREASCQTPEPEQEPGEDLDWDEEFALQDFLKSEIAERNYRVQDGRTDTRHEEKTDGLTERGDEEEGEERWTVVDTGGEGEVRDTSTPLSVLSAEAQARQNAAGQGQDSAGCPDSELEVSCQPLQEEAKVPLNTHSQAVSTGHQETDALPDPAHSENNSTDIVEASQSLSGGSTHHDLSTSSEQNCTVTPEKSPPRPAETAPACNPSPGPDETITQSGSPQPTSDDRRGGGGGGGGGGEKREEADSTTGDMNFTKSLSQDQLADRTGAEDSTSLLPVLVEEEEGAQDTTEAPAVAISMAGTDRLAGSGATPLSDGNSPQSVTGPTVPRTGQSRSGVEGAASDTSQSDDSTAGGQVASGARKDSLTLRSKNKRELELSRSMEAIEEHKMQEDMSETSMTTEKETETSVISDTSDSYREDSNSLSPTDKEIETEFQRLSLGFKCDMFTLEKRLRLEERSRDLAEENVRREVSSCQGLLQALIPLCEDDNQSMEIIQRLQKNLDILIQSMTRVSSRSEMLGAIHQESRIGKAVEVMIQHVENLRRMYTKEHAELLELREALMQNERSFGSQTERDDFRGKKPSSSQYYKTSARRVSIAAIPRSSGSNTLFDMSKTQDTSDAETERLTRRSPCPSPTSSPTVSDPVMTPSLSQSLTSSRAAAAAAVARGGRGLWLWLAMVVVLAGLLALLASLVMQPAVDAAPVGTGDSWMTIQQLLWPYTGLRHNGQPPV